MEITILCQRSHYRRKLKSRIKSDIKAFINHIKGNCSFKSSVVPLYPSLVTSLQSVHHTSEYRLLVKEPVEPNALLGGLTTNEGATADRGRVFVENDVR